MAAKGEATVKITMSDGGTVTMTKKRFDALNATVDKTLVKQTALAAGSNRTKRNLEGVSARANNTSKDFSRMSQGMGGLVQAYATVAANVFALSTAFNVLKDATNFQDMISSARNLSAELGTSFLTTAKAIQGATKAQIDFKTALRAANKASASGISAKNVTKFAEAAAKSAQTFGGTTTDALNRMVTAILQGETELLKEVGIVISSNEAFLQYGITIGKAANQLTSFEKRQALSNAVLKESDRLFAGTDIQENQYEILAANILDASQEVLKFVNNSLGLSAVIGALADSMPAVAAGVGLFAASVVRQLRPAVGDVLKQAKIAAANITKLEKMENAKLIKAKKSIGVEQLQQQKKDADIRLAASKKASQEQIQVLVKEGKLKASALRKGSALRASLEGGTVTRAGANSALKGKALGANGLQGAIVGKGLLEVADNQKAADLAARKLATGTALADKASKSFITTLKIQAQQFRNTNATTKASILTATQGAGVWGTYTIATDIANKKLKLMEVQAKKTGVAVTFLGKAGVKAAKWMAVLGKAAGKAFTLFTTLIIVFEVAKFALDALGISFGDSAAQEKLIEATNEMNTAFDESTLTLNGMIKSFERFKDLSPDLAFQKGAIAAGNFVQEIGANFGKSIGVAVTGLKELENATRGLAEAQQANTDADNNAPLRLLKGGGVALVQTKERADALDNLTAAQDRYQKAQLTGEDATLLATKSFIRLKDVVRDFSASNVDFPLFDKLKETSAIKDILSPDQIKRVKTATGLISAFQKEISTLSNPIQILELFASLETAFIPIGERSVAAGKGVEELRAKLVLFEGTNTRLQKTVFKSEALQNYVSLVELASKTIGTLDAAGRTGASGLNEFAAAFGITADRVRDFVKEFESAVAKAGQETLDNNVLIETAKIQQKILSIQNKLEQDIGKDIALIQQRMNTKRSEMALDLANAKIRVKILNLARKSTQAEDDKLAEINSKLQAAQATRQGSAILSFFPPGEDVKALETQKKILQSVIHLSTMNERELKEKKQLIKLIEKQLELHDENRVVNKAIGAELASIRQHYRNIANLKLQNLNGEVKLAKVSGNVTGLAVLKEKSAQQSLFLKIQDLDLDLRALEFQKKTTDLSNQKYNRELQTFKLREKGILLAEKARQVELGLNKGRVFSTAQAAKPLDGSGIAADITEVSTFESIMLEGARAFRDEVAKPQARQILSQGAVGAVGAGVDSLVSTVGAEDENGKSIDDIKALITAVNDTLRTTVVEALTQGIKTELLKILFEGKLNNVLTKADSEAKKGVDAFIKQSQELGVSKTTFFQSSNLTALGLINTSILSTAGAGGSGKDNMFSAFSKSLINNNLDGGGTPDPTKLAVGGVVHKPTFSMIGEGKNSEAVVPLPNNREIPVKLEGNTGESNQITNNYDFSGADAATETRLRGLIQDSREGAFQDVFSSINRGGKFAKMTGRR